MNFDQQIEQLAFGRSLPRMDSCLGLFLSPTTIFIAEVAVPGGKPKVLHLVRLPVPGTDDSKVAKSLGSLNTEFLADHEKLGAILKKALTDIKWGSKHVMVSLSHHFGILRYFAMPAIDRRFWKTAIPAEAKKYVPIPFATLTYDFLVNDLGVGVDKKPRQGTLFGVTHKQNLENLRKLTESLGLILVGTELAPCSVERLWDAVDPGPVGIPYAQVHFDGGHVRVLISDNGLPIFFREIFLPSDATVMDRRKVDLAGCINFTKKQIGSRPPEKVRLSGLIGDMGAWQQAFTQDLGRQVDYQDTDKALGLKGGQWGGYAAVGSALRHLISTPLTLDLSTVGRISDEDRQAAKTILLISALAATLFLITGGFQFTMAGLKSRELSQMMNSGLILEEFQGKRANDIALMMNDMKKRVNAFGPLVRKRVPITYVHERIAELIPEAAWITHLAYTNPLGIGGGRSYKPRTLVIDGKVIDQSVSMEQDVAYQFADRLRKDKVFRKVFPSVEIEVVTAKKTRGGKSAKAFRSSEDSIKNRLSNATKFKILCLSRKKKK